MTAMSAAGGRAAVAPGRGLIDRHGLVATLDRSPERRGLRIQAADATPRAGQARAGLAGRPQYRTAQAMAG
jgi:hypothetical protein